MIQWTRALATIAVLASPFACTESKPSPPADASDAGERPTPRMLEGGTERPETLVLALTPVASKIVMLREYRPLADYLAKKLGIPVDLVVPDSYASVIDRFARYELHVAIFSPLNYVLAKKRVPGLIVLASPIVQGASSYASYVVTRETSGITSLAGLRGKRFAFVDRSSTSGFLYPYAHLLEQGYHPETFFGSMTFLGDHSAVVAAVMDGTVDAGATFAAAINMLREPTEASTRFSILAKTGRIPYDAYVASPRLSQEIIDGLRSALLSLNTRTDEGRQILRGTSGINGFVEVGDEHYDGIRKVYQRVEEGRGSP